MTSTGMTITGVPGRPAIWPERLAPTGVAVALGAAVTVGAMVGLLGFLGLVGILGLGVVVAIAARPQLGAYLFLATMPLVVGIDRGVLVPLARPHEAVLLAAVSGLTLRGLVRFAQGAPLRISLTRIDWAIIAMAVTSSMTPLLWMFARGRDIALDDLLYATALWKYYALFVVIRSSVRTEHQVRRCLLLIAASCAVVAVVAVLQSLQLAGVTGLLNQWFANADEVDPLALGRGSSTVGSSIAVGDMMAFLLAAVIAWWKSGDQHRVSLALAAGIFLLGGLASGQFTAAIALVVAAMVAGVLTRSLGRMLAAGIPVVVAATFLMQPVIEARLAGFQSSAGVPQSWTVRLQNLRTYFWPPLSEDWNWVLGVRTSARVPAPEVWREWVYIESGHTWLLWNGGVLLLIAFFVFLGVALPVVVRIARSRTDAIGVAAVASSAALSVLAVVMLFDPHLTMRGTADLNVALLALALTAWGRRWSAEPEQPPSAGKELTWQRTSA